MNNSKVQANGNQPSALNQVETENAQFNVTDPEKIVQDIVKNHSENLAGSESSWYNDTVTGQSYLYLGKLMGYAPLKFPVNRLQMKYWLENLAGANHDVFPLSEKDTEGASTEDLSSVEDIRKVVFNEVFNSGRYKIGRVVVIPYGSTQDPNKWTVKIYMKKRRAACVSFYVDKDGDEIQALRRAHYIL